MVYNYKSIYTFIVKLSEFIGLQIENNNKLKKVINIV